LDAGLAQRLQSMTKGIHINLDDPLTADDE
jgi:hypothetical protein